MDFDEFRRTKNRARPQARGSQWIYNSIFSRTAAVDRSVPFRLGAFAQAPFQVREKSFPTHAARLHAFRISPSISPLT